MHTVTLELADNGLIKTVADDNINAAGEGYESVVVYDFESSNSNETKIKFLNDISMDAGLELGNPKDKKQIKIVQEWGDSYAPTPEEIMSRITYHTLEIKRLESLLKA
jgi:hypothetical protein